MKTPFYKLILSIAALLISSLAIAAPDIDTLNVQGYMKQSNGSAVTDGTYSMAFGVFQNGSAVWGTSGSVTVSNGLFSKSLTGTGANLTSLPSSTSMNANYTSTTLNATLLQTGSGVIAVRIYAIDTINGSNPQFDVSLNSVPTAFIANLAQGIVSGGVSLASIATASKANVSTGSGDAGKIVLLDSTGVIDISMIPSIPANKTSGLVTAGSNTNITALTGITGQISSTGAGAASAPALKLSGAPYNAGTTTTAKALLLLEDASTSTGWNVSGTYVGVNAATGFAGNLIDLQQNGVSKFNVSSTGAINSAGAFTNSAAGAASTSALKLTGAPFAAGTATTNKPLLLLEDASTSNGWSTAGTYLGVNAASGFNGNLMDLQVNGVSKFSVTSVGSFSFAGALSLSTTLTNSTAGAANTSAIKVTGAPFAAGTATTNKPIVLIEDAATSTGWSTSGTYLGVNAASAFNGNLLDLQQNGVSKFSVTSIGTITETAAVTNSTAGTSSTSALKLSGAPYDLGTATTSKPLLLIENAATSTGWSTSGTYLGVNAASAFNGNLLDLQQNGVSKFNVTSIGAITNSAAGSANISAIKVTGAPFALGTATTNKPLVLIENAGTSTGWNTSGTYLGVNASSSFNGNLMDLQQNGTSKFSVTSIGTTTATTLVATAGAGFQNMVVQTSGTSWTLPAALQVTGAKFKVTIVGGGGGGGGTGTSAGQTGGGGGSGGAVVGYYTYVAGQNTMTYAIGTSGGGGTAGNNGSNGGASSTTYNAVAYTANGGSGGTANGAGGAGGTVSGGTLSIAGATGYSGGATAATSNFTGDGGTTPLGLGTAGVQNSTTGGGAGASGTGYGAGGSGGRNGSGTTGRAGGAGLAGVVIIEY